MFWALGLASEFWYHRCYFQGFFCCLVQRSCPSQQRGKRRRWIEFGEAFRYEDNKLPLRVNYVVYPRQVRLQNCELLVFILAFFRKDTQVHPACLCGAVVYHMRGLMDELK